jgi:hypothetical protein
MDGLKQAIASGANVNGHCGPYSHILISEIIRVMNLLVFDVLIAVEGLDVNPGRGIMPPLHMAITVESASIRDHFITALLNRGASVDRLCDESTILRLSLAFDYLPYEILVAHSNDISAVGVDGLTALHDATMRKNMDISIVESLLRHNANPDVPDSRGNTPFHYAVLVSVNRLEKAWVDSQPLPRGQERTTYVPDLAALTNLILLYMDFNANPTLRNGSGQTPGGVACAGLTKYITPLVDRPELLDLVFMRDYRDIIDILRDYEEVFQRNLAIPSVQLTVSSRHC